MRIQIDARNIDYRELNLKIRDLISQGKRDLFIKNVLGQRYIGGGLKSDSLISIEGTPGNDLGAFMDGPALEIYGNGQDGIGNTMNSGKIIIHGDAGDILGYSMRGGDIYIEKSVGWRCGIHMKSFKDKIPSIVIGGSAGNFLGEYMAGGIIVLLGLHKRPLEYFPYSGREEITGSNIGTGMHGGAIYLRGKTEEYKIGKEVRIAELNGEDCSILEKFVKRYCNYFNYDPKEIPAGDFIKLIPYSHRPYGKLYAY